MTEICESLLRFLDAGLGGREFFLFGLYFRLQLIFTVVEAAFGQQPPIQFNEFFFGVHNPLLVHIPNHVWHGWKNIGTETAMVINIPTEAYDYDNPDEFRAPAHGGKIDYDWMRQDG